VTPQQNIVQPTQIMPPVQPPAPQYNQFVSDQAQIYSVPQREPQSTVNGQPIYPEQIVAVYKLKGPYIEYRETELKKEFAEHQKKKLGIEWLLDEQDMLRNLVGPADTLKLLEMDVIIQDALRHFSSVSNDVLLNPLPLLEKMYKDVQKKYQGYPKEEIKNVLLVFVHYRILSEYFRRQNSPRRLKHWLDMQWLTIQDQGRIVRSPNPLPDVK
jgi:hypothetical protein